MGEKYTLDEAAIVMHEWFLSMMLAGFTEDQALKCIAYTMRPDPNQEPGS